PLGVNAIRLFPVVGPVAWGARTLRGADGLADEYKYIPVRRLALFLEESLYRGTQWVVFEPNDEPLWAQIRLNVGAFMQNLVRAAAAGRPSRSSAPPPTHSTPIRASRSASSGTGATSPGSARWARSSGRRTSSSTAKEAPRPRAASRPGAPSTRRSPSSAA